MKLNKFLAAFLAVFMSVSFAACSSDDDDKDDGSSNGSGVLSVKDFSGNKKLTHAWYIQEDNGSLSLEFWSFDIVSLYSGKTKTPPTTFSFMSINIDNMPNGIKEGTYSCSSEVALGGALLLDWNNYGSLFEDDCSGNVTISKDGSKYVVEFTDLPIEIYGGDAEEDQTVVNSTASFKYKGTITRTENFYRE